MNNLGSQIMSLLCAFVCNPPKLEKETRGEELRADVQGVMEAIAAAIKHKSTKRTISWNCLERFWKEHPWLMEICLGCS